MIYFADRRIMARRNQRGWITGIRIERIINPFLEYDQDFAQGLFNFPVNLKDTLTKEQVEQLPLIEYNISDLESAVKEYSQSKNGIYSYLYDEKFQNNNQS